MPDYGRACSYSLGYEVGQEADDLCRHDLTETTRTLAKTGSDDLKKLASLQAQLVCTSLSLLVMP